MMVLMVFMLQPHKFQLWRGFPEPHPPLTPEIFKYITVTWYHEQRNAYAQKQLCTLITLCL